MLLHLVTCSCFMLMHKSCHKTVLLCFYSQWSVIKSNGCVGTKGSLSRLLVFYSISILINKKIIWSTFSSPEVNWHKLTWKNSVNVCILWETVTKSKLAFGTKPWSGLRAGLLLGTIWGWCESSINWKRAGLDGILGRNYLLWECWGTGTHYS